MKVNQQVQYMYVPPPLTGHITQGSVFAFIGLSRQYMGTSEDLGLFFISVTVVLSILEQ